MNPVNLFNCCNEPHCMIDYHIHSTYSIDGKSPPHLYVGAAQKCVLKEIGFAEHVDLDPHVWGYRFLDPGYYAACRTLGKSVSIPIRCGIEVSYQDHLENSIKEYVSGADCDFVIGSVHEVHTITMDKTFLQQHNPSHYFEAVEKMVKSSTCDIVGHLEYFKRWGGTYTSSAFKNEICAVLQVMIETDCVLEVNTSGLRHPCHDTYPSLDVIHWYRELGGELISLGSDAHDAETIAFRFSPVRKRLTSEGFDTVATFNRRKLELTEL